MSFPNQFRNPTSTSSIDPIGMHYGPGLAVTELGILAHRALQRAPTGQIMAVFARFFYVVLDDFWICVGPREIGSSPLQVLCESSRQSGLTRGNAVAVIGKTIQVQDKPFARFDVPSLWAPQHIPDWKPGNLRVGLSAVDQFWCGSLIEEGLAAAGCGRFPAGHSQLVEAARPGLAALTRFIDSGLQGCFKKDG